MVDYPNPAALAAAAEGDFVNAEIAATPGGIERQEAAGQAALVASRKMWPREMSPSREAFEAVGFTFGEPIDDVMIIATLPEGWTRQATEHAMHSDVLDEKGRKRVAIFYKAAFYDRRADATLLPRFTLDRLYAGEVIDAVAFAVKDAGTFIKTWEIPQGDTATDGDRDSYLKRREVESEVRAKATEWLAAEKPAFADPTAYWNDA